MFSNPSPQIIKLIFYSVYQTPVSVFQLALNLRGRRHMYYIGLIEALNSYIYHLQSSRALFLEKMTDPADSQDPTQAAQGRRKSRKL